MKFKFNYKSTVAFALVVLGSLATASAAVTSISLGGTTTTEGWNSLSNTTISGYPGYPGTGNWPSPVASQVGTITAPDTRATLNKTSNGTQGGPYFGNGYIYHGGTSSTPNILGGSLAIADATPLSGVRTVVFQIEINNPFGHSFHNATLPTLSYTAGGTPATNVAASYSAIIDSKPGAPFQGNAVDLNTWALQWDLPAGVSEFTIGWSSVQHAQIYALQLDQGSAVALGSVLPAAVPEPASLALAAAGALIGLRRRRNS